MDHIEGLEWDAMERLFADKLNVPKARMEESVQSVAAPTEPAIVSNGGATVEPVVMSEPLGGHKRSFSEYSSPVEVEISKTQKTMKAKVIAELEPFMQQSSLPEGHGGVVYMDYRHFELAKRGEYKKLWRNIKVLTNASSRSLKELFHSAYNRLLDDSFELPQEHLNRNMILFTKSGNYFNRYATQSGIRHRLEQYCGDGWRDYEQPRGRSVLLEAQLVGFAKNKNWKELQYHFDLLENSHISSKKMKTLFQNVYSILNK
jgi:hypothetical protein